jgi:hypothetical protein
LFLFICWNNQAMADQIEQMNIALDSHQKVLFVSYYI